MSNVRKMGPYVIGETLGVGGFCKVKLGVHQSTGEKVALKLLNTSKLSMNESSHKQVRREIAAMQKVQHQNVIRLKEVDFNAVYLKKNGKEQQVLLVVLELAKGGELFEFLSFTGAFEEAIGRTYFHQLIDGLSYCHSQGVVHRDLKPENLLLDESFTLKLADFGFSNVTDAEHNLMFTECGTPGYMAPEMFLRQGYDPAKADIWAVGVVLFIMLAGFPPFQKPNETDWWFHKLKNNRHDLFWRAHCRTVYFSDAQKDLLNKILCPDPAKRISLEDIKRHDWFTLPIMSTESLYKELGKRKEKVDGEKWKEKQAKLARERGGPVGSTAMTGVTANVRALGDEMVGDLPPSMEFFTHGLAREEAGMRGSFGSMGLGMGMGGMGGMGDEIKGQAEVYDSRRMAGCYTRIESARPATELYNRVMQTLKAIATEYSPKENSLKINKVKVDGDQGGQVTMAVQVFADPNGKTNHIEFKRLNGDGMAYRSTFNLVRDALSDLAIADKAEAKR